MPFSLIRLLASQIIMISFYASTFLVGKLKPSFKFLFQMEYTGIWSGYGDAQGDMQSWTQEEEFDIGINGKNIQTLYLFYLPYIKLNY